MEGKRKEKGERGGAGGLPSLGWFRAGPVGYCPLFWLTLYLFYFLFSTKPFKRGSKLAKIKSNFFVKFK
jgi:hypothetical protein